MGFVLDSKTCQKGHKAATERSYPGLALSVQSDYLKQKHFGES